MSQDPKDGEIPAGSTLQRRALEALTFDDMGQFVRQLETRTLDRLFFDLPALLRLPEATFSLVPGALRRRMKGADERERQVIHDLLEALRDRAPNDEQRTRCDRILGRLD